MNNIEIEDVTIINTAGDAISIRGNPNLKMLRVAMSNIGGHGLNYNNQYNKQFLEELEKQVEKKGTFEDRQTLEEIKANIGTPLRVIKALGKLISKFCDCAEIAVGIVKIGSYSGRVLAIFSDLHVGHQLQSVLNAYQATQYK